MAITVYRHTDASAPTLTGQVGSLTSLLLACLVNGYGAKAAAGWTNPYNGTNQRVFRPASGVQHYFALDDNAPGSAQYARLQGFETMSAWATGTGPFPTVGQSAILVPLLKSSTADATARPWVVVADGRSCYVLSDFSHTTTQYGTGTVPIYSGGGFGEVYSLLATADSYRSFVLGKSAEATTTFTDLVASGSPNSATMPGHWSPRDYTGIGGSVAARTWGDWARGAAGTAAALEVFGAGGFAVPEPVTGAIHLAPVHWTTGGNLRGRLRGFFHLCHASTSFAEGDTITGSGAYAGRTFLVVKGVQSVTVLGSAGTTGGALVFDITGAWETN